MLKFFRMLAQALAAADSPKQLSAGFALGAAAGLVPKSSLFTHLLLVVLAASEANYASGFVALGLFSLLGLALDPVFHPIGASLLHAGALRGLWTFLYNLPIVPWTQFNNTVVLGAFVAGLALIFPLYKGMIPAFEKYSETIGARLRKFKIVQLLLGADLASRVKGLG
ncbi:MAG: TIGR03546 family protein [Elusimicrobia bacterium]|nr:TIGR03546 family protein [Elusimicrobiota bacterium]